MKKIVKTEEKQTGRKRVKRESHNLGKENNGDGSRRDVRSQYLQINNLVNVEGAGSDTFTSTIEQVEHLHQFVEKPREQVADAGALLNITNTLLTSIKSHSGSAITASEFISSLLRKYGTGKSSLRWKDLGRNVSPVFMKSAGCSTMLGPMDVQLKRRKAAVQRKSAVSRRQTKKSKIPPPPPHRPEELDHNEAERQTDTDINIATMFDILKETRSVRLECLILNRKCFAQTVENLFALSFLVKDGRVKITIDESNTHIVSPRNAPSSISISSGQVSYHHFMFRFDFSDWKLMMDTVPVGKELMPHRSYFNSNTRSSLVTTQKCDQAPSKNPLIEEQSAKEIPLDEREFSKFHEISSGCDEDVCKDSVIEISSGCSGDANSHRYPVIDISSQEDDTDEDSEVVEIIRENRNICSTRMVNLTSWKMKKNCSARRCTKGGWRGTSVRKPTV